MPVFDEHPNYDKDYPNCGISAAREFSGDPRVNKNQIMAIEETCKHDADALMMGMDTNSLPVIRARVGQPRVSRSWAIRRNGDPTTAGAIYEVWGAPEHTQARASRA